MKRAGTASGKRLLLAAVVAASLLGTWLIAALGADRLVELMRLSSWHALPLIGLFAAWALVANLLVLPAGSLSLIAGGAVMGAMLPAAVWFLAQLVTAPLLYRTCAVDHARLLGFVDKYAGRVAAGVLDRAAEDGVWTTMLLRLTPVLPSAPACMIAAASGIGLRQFLAGSVLAGWVRPLYFAGFGAGLGSLARLTAGEARMSWCDLWPLLAAFGLAVAAVAVRQRAAARPLKARAAAPASSARGD